MIKYFYIVALICSSSSLFATEDDVTSIPLQYINGEEVLSVLKTLIDKSVSVTEQNNILLVKGSPSKTKNIAHIISKIDTPPTPLTVEFIASSRKINFTSDKNTFHSNKSKNNTSQSMSIIERQWVRLNTGISIPIAERKRYADGTETQSFSFKKVSKSYIFKVHEFSGWSVVQVGVNASELSDDIASAISHTELDTTIVGKTGQWLEVASSKRIQDEDETSTTYSTERENKNLINLYIKVNKAKGKNILTPTPTANQTEEKNSSSTQTEKQ